MLKRRKNDPTRRRSRQPLSDHRLKLKVEIERRPSRSNALGHRCEKLSPAT